MKKVRIIFSKELKSYFDSPIAYIFIVIFLLLTGTYFINTLFLDNFASLRSVYEAASILMIFFCPAITMRLISEEKRSGTLEMLTTKAIKTGEIILGKFFAAWFLLLCALAPTLIYFLSVSTIGEIDSGPVLGAYLGLMLMGGAFLAIGILGSTLSESQIVAFIIGFVIILLLFSIDKFLAYLPLDIVPVVDYFGVNSHFSSLARGVVDTRDVLYFVSLMVLSLLLSTILAEIETVGTVLKLRGFSWKEQLPRLGLVSFILVMVNLLSLQLYERFDLTSNKAYTLTEETKELLSKLDDDFVVKGYFTANVPPPYSNYRQLVQELLDEYRAYAPGKFHYQFVNPSADQDIEQEALEYGLIPKQVKVIKNDKFMTEKAYLGLVFIYGTKTEQLAELSSLEQLEYLITSNMRRLVSPQERTIALTAGQGEATWDEMNGLRKLLSKQYSLTTVNLKEVREIPLDVAALLIVGPTQRFDDKRKYLLDQYIMRGGKVAFFINNVLQDEDTLKGFVPDLNLDDMFDNYGWVLNTDLVMDAQCVSVSAVGDTTAPGTLREVHYPFYPVANNYHPDNPIVKNLPPVAFTYVSSIDARLAPAREVTVEVLLSSSKQSSHIEGAGADLGLNQNFNFASFAERDLPLAVSVKGQFKSLYAKRKGEGGQQALIARSPLTRLIVVGDGDFVRDRYQHGNDNLSFAVNLIDWLVNDVSLTSIRSRSAAPKPLPEIDEKSKIIFKYVNFTAPPFVIIIAGIIRMIFKAAIRSRHKKF